MNFENLIPSFPRRRESGSFGFACFKFRVTSTSSFPRRRESGSLNFSYLE
ncbi:PilS cassette [Neisseria meningitidis serogroup B]|uniref:PilS cassette n=1 Tax=Neisseria meningitidis serogroup B TaxID=491 RepID=A0A0H5Q9N0_NEIMI|nr:PilS cassette [Neisseria meningitidis serogroup B]